MDEVEQIRSCKGGNHKIVARRGYTYTKKKIYTPLNGFPTATWECRRRSHVKSSKRGMVTCRATLKMKGERVWTPTSSVCLHL